jgi:hypothetical protein
MFWYYLVNHTRKEYCQLMPSDLGDSRRNFAYPINWTQQDQVEIISKKTFYTVEAADGKYDEVDMFDLGVDSEEDFSGPSDLSESEDGYSHSHSPQSGGSRRSHSGSESSRHSHSESSRHSHSESESEDSDRGHSRRHHSDSEDSNRGHSDTEEEVKRPEEIKRSEEPRRSDGLAKRLVESKPLSSAKLSTGPALREMKRSDEGSKRPIEDPKRLVEVSKRPEEVSKISDSRKSRK